MSKKNANLPSTDILKGHDHLSICCGAKERRGVCSWGRILENKRTGTPNPPHTRRMHALSHDQDKCYLGFTIGDLWSTSDRCTWHRSRRRGQNMIKTLVTFVLTTPAQCATPPDAHGLQRLRLAPTNQSHWGVGHQQKTPASALRLKSTPFVFLLPESEPCEFASYGQ